MAFNPPPWPPDMDARSTIFYERLRVEKYDGVVDALGNIRWCSDWRVHVGNGCADNEAYSRISTNIDQIRAGQFPTAWPSGQYSVPWYPVWEVETPRAPDGTMRNDAEDFDFRLNNLYQFHQNRPVDATGYTRWSSDYRIARANGLSHNSAWQKIEYEILDIWNVVPPAGAVARPVIGLARQGNLFALNGKTCTPEFSSEFNLLHIRRTNLDMYYRLLDDAVRYKKQGSRIFTAVGGWAALPGDFWYGCGVYPFDVTPWQFDRKDGHLRPKTDANGNPMYGPVIKAWPDYDEHFVSMMEDLVKRKLAGHFTLGDAQILFSPIVNGWPKYDAGLEMAHHKRVLGLIKQVDPRYAVFYEARNEYPINSPRNGDKQDVADMQQFLREVKNQIPTALCGLGAPLSEEPAKLEEAVGGFDVCFVHVSRDWPMCLKRTGGLRYWEGQWGAFQWPYMNGEPKPMNVPPFHDQIGDDGYNPTERVDQLIALHICIAVTSQGDNLFTGASVRLDTYPSLMPGYREISVIVEEHVPEDVDTWGRETLGNGAILYITKDKQFLTWTDEEWDTTPPRPVASWKMYTGRGMTIEVLEGINNPPQGRTGFIVGTFK